MTQFICIGGKAQNGKDTTASIMKEELESRGKKVLLTHYADLLKFMCRRYRIRLLLIKLLSEKSNFSHFWLTALHFCENMLT